MSEWIKLLQDNDYLGIKKYLKNGAEVNDSNESGESVLALALRYRCDDEIVDILLDNGSDLDDFNEDGVSILDGADKSAIDIKGFDALAFAKKTHKTSMIELLENS